ncbi:MAG: peptidoglycan-binding domain-containing protein [Gammaproteobacteria bacterium]
MAAYAAGSTDGKPGPSTRRAIRRFQAKIGTKRTGHLSPEEIGQLMGTPSLGR